MKLASERRSSLLKRAVSVLAPLAFCVAFILGCGSGRTETRTAPIQTPPSYTPASAESSAPLLVPTPTPGPFHFVSAVPYGPGVPTLDENIFHADVIALVRPPAVEGKSKTVPSEDGVAPTYRPLTEFQFEVVEYLKGSGGKTLTVEYPQSHTYLTDDEALSVATRLTSDRSATADGLPRYSAPVETTVERWSFFVCRMTVTRAPA